MLLKGGGGGGGGWSNLWNILMIILLQIVKIGLHGNMYEYSKIWLKLKSVDQV